MIYKLLMETTLGDQLLAWLERHTGLTIIPLEQLDLLGDAFLPLTLTAELEDSPPASEAKHGTTRYRLLPR